MNIKNEFGSVLQEAISYEEYRLMVSSLIEQGKTTGSDQSEAMVEYTRVNGQRMNRIDKTFKFSESSKEKINSIDKPIDVLCITEGWCGDAAQIIPTIANLLSENKNLNLKLVLRDEHPAFMDHFLTNGTRSIPKFVFMDHETGHVLGSFGPRPKVLAEKILAMKAENPLLVKDDIVEAVHTWYAHDKTITTQAEFSDSLVEALKA
jgi:hypothetical protein